MDRKSDSILICVRVDRCCNRHWRCIFFVGFILLIVFIFTFLMRSGDQGPILETNWQKHWSETQNLDAGSKQVLEPAGNVVNARDEFVDQYAAHEHNPETFDSEYYDRDEVNALRSDYEQQYRNDEMVGKQSQEKPGSMGIVRDIHDFSLQKNFKFIFNTSVDESIVFDENYLNPCWAESIPKLPYQNNFYAKVKDLASTLDTSFKFMRQLFSRRSDASNHWRLRCLPYFYVLEAPPTATPRLYNALRFHPSIVNPEVAEPEFWNEKGPGGLATLRDYLDLFDTASENIRNSTSSVMMNGATVLKHKRITGDGTSSYLWTLNSWRRIVGNLGELEPKTIAATLIRQFTPDAKIIMVLRNPTERLFQGYLQRTDNPSASDFHDKAGKAMTSLSECERKRSVRACVYDTFLNQRQLVRLRIGMYYPFVKDWIDVFGREQVKVIRYEDYLNSPSEIISEVCSFLGIPPYPTKDLESMEFMVKDLERKRKEKEKLRMLSTTRRMLKDFHKKLNRQLADLLSDEKFTWSDMADESDPSRPQAIPSDSQKNNANEKNTQQEQQEQQERERQERERQERERQERERQERERQERERQDRERQDRERQTKEQQQRDQQQRDQQLRDQQLRDQQLRDQQQRDQQLRDQQLRDQQLRQQSEEQKRLQQQKEQQLREELQRMQQQQQLQRAQQSQQQGQQFQQQGQQNQQQGQQNQQQGQQTNQQGQQQNQQNQQGQQNQQQGQQNQAQQNQQGQQQNQQQGQQNQQQAQQNQQQEQQRLQFQAQQNQQLQQGQQQQGQQAQQQGQQGQQQQQRQQGQQIQQQGQRT